MNSLRCPDPNSAETFDWKYDLTFATYALTVVSPKSGADHTLWLEGGVQSGPLPVTRLPSPMQHGEIAQSYFVLDKHYLTPRLLLSSSRLSIGNEQLSPEQTYAVTFERTCVLTSRGKYAGTRVVPSYGMPNT